MPFDLLIRGGLIRGGLIRGGLLVEGYGAPGRPAIRDGEETGERPGRLLRRDA
ncbi:MAG TPA: hypothetical protein VIK13_09245 [Candidatus Limnocylindrales bacterium]